MSSRFVGLVAACAAINLGGVCWGVVNGTPIPNTDKRFDAVGLFMAAAPGSCGGWISGSCTLVGPTTVLIARHSLDVQPTQPIPTVATRPCRVRFRRAADGTSENHLLVGGVTCHGVYQEIDVVQLTDAPNPNSDQVIATLAHAPTGIQPIGMELNTAPSAPMSIILAGWGYNGECFGAGEPWVLRMARGTSPTNSATSDFFAFSYCTIGTVAPCLTCPAGPARANANLHDSGAPVLMEVPSADPTDPTPELRLLGSVSTLSYARRPSAWNHSGGVPLMAQAVTTSHIKKSDFDGNGQITTTDVFGFLGAFLGGRLDADANGNGVLDIQDVFLFLDEWFAAL